MTFKDLLQSFLTKNKELVMSGAGSKIRRRELVALRIFAAWADRCGYQITRPVGENGAAIFCATCGGFISDASMSNEPEGGDE